MKEEILVSNLKDNVETVEMEEDLITEEDVLEEDYVVRAVLKQLAAMLEMLDEHLTLGYNEDRIYACTLRDGIEDVIETTFEEIKDFVDDSNASMFTE